MKINQKLNWLILDNSIMVSGVVEEATRGGSDWRPFILYNVERDFGAMVHVQ